jgi:hypothetical protein
MSDNAQAPLRAEDVLRDVGYEGFVRSLFNVRGDPDRDFSHAVLGIATEVTELLFAVDEVHGLDESGDLRFYGQALINFVEQHTGVDFDQEQADREYVKLVNVGQVEGTEDAIDKARKILLDHCKRWVGYEKEPSDLMAACAQAIALVQFTTAHARYGCTDADRVELANVAKLLKRYKGLKFDVTSATNKDVAAERAVVEAAS